MTKIEELKAAYEAATQGEWEVVFDEPDDVQLLFSGEMQLGAMQNWGNGVGYDNAHLIALMHNTLPALLEAAELLDDLINSYDDTGCEGCGVVDSSINERAIALREKLS